VSEEIIVTGVPGGGGGGAASAMAFTYTYNTGYDTPPTVDLTPTAPGNTELQVKVDVMDSAHTNDALTTAQQTITIVGKLLNAANGHLGDVGLLMPDGSAMSVAEFKSMVSESHIVITDDTSKTLGRDGLADHLHNTIYIAYNAFTNTGGHWGGQGESGMIGMMLHEYGHLSNAGWNNTNQEAYWYTQEKAQTKMDPGTADYSADNESFADAFVFEAQNDLGLDASNFLTAPGVNPFGYRGGAEIFQEHMAGISSLRADEYSSVVYDGGWKAEMTLPTTDYDLIV